MDTTETFFKIPFDTTGPLFKVFFNMLRKRPNIMPLNEAF